MARDAQRSLLMYAVHAIERATAPRRVREPGVPRAHNVINGGTHGVLRRLVGRRVVNARAQLVLGVVRTHAYVVSALLAKHARRELVPGERLHLMRLRDRVLSIDELLGPA